VFAVSNRLQLKVLLIGVRTFTQAQDDTKV
jgi:hypothetical protein